MKRVLYFIAICTSTGFLSCKKDKASEPSQKPINPIAFNFDFIKVGNEWLYNVESYDSLNGPLYKTYSSKIKSMENNKYKIAVIFGQDEERTGVYWTKDNNEWAATDSSNSYKDIILKSNPSIGDKYTNIRNGDTTYVEILDLTESVTVPLGNYTCTKVKEYTMNNSNYTLAYFNTTAGLVMLDFYVNGMKQASFKLKSKNF